MLFNSDHLKPDSIGPVGNVKKGSTRCGFIQLLNTGTFMAKRHSEYTLGLILLLLSVLTYSSAGIFTKSVEAGAWSVIFWRGIFAALFTTGWTLHRKTFRSNFFSMGQSGWMVGVVGAIGTAAYISSFKLTTIANVSLIYAAAPLIAAVLAWYFIGERITNRTLVGCFGAMIGVAIIVSGSIGQVNLKGDALALIMTLVMASIMVIYRKYPSTPSAGPAVLQSLFLFPAALWFGKPFQTEFMEIVVLAVFGFLFAIATVALAEGAKRVPAGQTALLSALDTPLAPILAFLILQEFPATATFVGGAIVLAAIVLTTKTKED